MTDSQASKWNARYAFSEKGIPAPARVLSQGVRWLPNAHIDSNAEPPISRRALDLACGRAGNGQFLQMCGFHVCAWDVSDRVIEDLRSRQPAVIAEAEVRDVLLMPPEPDSFDVIVVSRFLDRALCPMIAAALKPEGVLFYQTFVHGLANPDYLLAPNELLSLFSQLHVLEYLEPEKDANGKSEARLIAKRGAFS